MWKGLWGLQCEFDNVIPPELVLESQSWLLHSWLACNASAVYSVYWGVAWQFLLSRDALEGIST